MTDGYDHSHAPDNPSDFGDFDASQRCVECGEYWPCAYVRAHAH